MARDDWWEDYLSEQTDWPRKEQELFADLAGYDDSILEDRMLRSLFNGALFDLDVSKPEREAIYGNLVDYIWDEYGIDFESKDAFDWEGYREWYDSVA